LIELLVVIGVIAIFTGVLGLGLHGSSSQGIALRSAQAQTAALLDAARNYAVLHQTPARLLIYATPPPLGDAEKYLRCFQIAIESPRDSGQWVAVGEPVVLSRTVAVIPPTMPENHLVPGVQWPTGSFAPLSLLMGPTDFALGGQDFGRAYSVEYAPDGRSTAGVQKLMLATVRPSPVSLACFDNPAAVRGIVLRSSGGT